MNFQRLKISLDKFESYKLTPVNELMSILPKSIYKKVIDLSDRLGKPYFEYIKFNSNYINNKVMNSLVEYHDDDMKVYVHKSLVVIDFHDYDDIILVDEGDTIPKKPSISIKSYRDLVITAPSYISDDMDKVFNRLKFDRTLKSISRMPVLLLSMNDNNKYHDIFNTNPNIFVVKAKPHDVVSARFILNQILLKKLPNVYSYFIDAGDVEYSPEFESNLKSELSGLSRSFVMSRNRMLFTSGRGKDNHNGKIKNISDFKKKIEPKTYFWSKDKAYKVSLYTMEGMIHKPEDYLNSFKYFSEYFTDDATGIIHEDNILANYLAVKGAKLVSIKGVSHHSGEENSMSRGNTPDSVVKVDRDTEIKKPKEFIDEYLKLFEDIDVDKIISDNKQTIDDLVKYITEK